MISMPINHASDLLSEDTPGQLRFGGVRMALLDIEAGFWSVRSQVEALIGARLTNSVLQQAGANGGASFASAFGSSNDIGRQEHFFESCVQSYQTAGFGKFEIKESHWPIGRVIIRANNAIEAWMLQHHGKQPDSPVCAYTAGVLVGFVNVISDRRDIVCIENHCQALGDDYCEFELLPVSETGNQSVVAFAKDPSLGRRLNLLEMLFERMPMGIAVIDRDFKLVRCNPTWAAFIEQYTPSKASQVVPGAGLFELEPGTEEVIIPLFQRVFQGETVHQDAVQIESGGIASFWDIVLSPLYEGGQVVGLLNVSIDATERVQLYRTLEQRVEDRTRELERRREIAESLRDIIAMINSNMPLESFLERATELAAQQMGATACVLHHFDFENQVLTHLANYGMPKEFRKGDVRPFELLRASGGIDYLRSIQQKQPTYGNYPPLPERVEEILQDKSIPEEIKKQRVELRKAFAGSLSVPLHIQDELYGGMAFYYADPQDFSEEQVQLAMTFAEQVSLAMENARLREQVEQAAAVQERNRLARDLHDAVSQTLFSATLIAEVLPKLWDKNPDAGHQKLDELRLLTRGALSEMRTLLLELRPASLLETDLGDLLRHLTTAFTGRNRTPIVYTLDGQADPPSDVKETFYRVAQEALNNIGKHAKATNVSVLLRRTEGNVYLVIRDDGCGFDPAEISPENFGLGIMHERAEAVGARLQIQSQAGTGTSVELTWKELEE